MYGQNKKSISKIETQCTFQAVSVCKKGEAIDSI